MCKDICDACICSTCTMSCAYCVLPRCSNKTLADLVSNGSAQHRFDIIDKVMRVQVSDLAQEVCCGIEAADTTGDCEPTHGTLSRD